MHLFNVYAMIVRAFNNVCPNDPIVRLSCVDETYTVQTSCHIYTADIDSDGNVLEFFSERSMISVPF